MLFFLAVGLSSARGVIETEWAYHAAANAPGNRAGESVPGAVYRFVDNGTLQVLDTQPVLLYLLTAQGFAGDANEQVFCRWWNGEEAHWVMGQWRQNIVLGNGGHALGTFHGQPTEGCVTVDLWRVVVPVEVLRPGTNHYALQLKGWVEGQAPEQLYLLRRAEGDFSGQNALGQDWSYAEDFVDRDWAIEIMAEDE